MKLYSVTIPYKETKSEKEYTITYEVEAPDKVSALKEGLRRFALYENYNYASWVRIPIKEKIKAEPKDSLLDPKKVKTLKSSLKKITSSENLTNILKKVCEYECSECLPELLALLKDEKLDEYTKVKIAMCFRKIADYNCIQNLLEIAQVTSSNKLKATIISSIGHLDPKCCIDELIKYLNHPDNRVRANAVEALAESSDPEISRLLFPLLLDNDNRVRANVIKILYRFSNVSIHNSLVEMARSKNKWMRASAAYAMKEMQYKEGLDIIKKLLDDPEIIVKLHAIRAYFSISKNYYPVFSLLEHSNKDVKNEIISCFKQLPLSDERKIELIKNYMDDYSKSPEAKDCLKSLINYNEANIFKKLFYKLCYFKYI